MKILRYNGKILSKEDVFIKDSVYLTEGKEYFLEDVVKNRGKEYYILEGIDAKFSASLFDDTGKTKQMLYFAASSKFPSIGERIECTKVFSTLSYRGKILCSSKEILTDEVVRVQQIDDYNYLVSTKDDNCYIIAINSKSDIMAINMEQNLNASLQNEFLIKFHFFGDKILVKLKRRKAEDIAFLRLIAPNIYMIRSIKDFQYFIYTV